MGVRFVLLSMECLQAFRSRPIVSIVTWHDANKATDAGIE